MAKTSERTSFTKDVQGRYLCNDISEVNAWQGAGGRPFDVIVIDGGTFGAAIAEHVWFRQKQTGGGLRTLVIEAGLFTVPEHVQNTGIQGFADPFTPFFLNKNLPSRSRRAMRCGAFNQCSTRPADAKRSAAEESSAQRSAMLTSPCLRMC